MTDRRRAIDDRPAADVRSGTYDRPGEDDAALLDHRRTGDDRRWVDDGQKLPSLAHQPQHVVAPLDLADADHQRQIRLKGGLIVYPEDWRIPIRPNATHVDALDHRRHFQVVCLASFADLVGEVLGAGHHDALQGRPL